MIGTAAVQSLPIGAAIITHIGPTLGIRRISAAVGTFLGTRAHAENHADNDQKHYNSLYFHFPILPFPDNYILL